MKYGWCDMEDATRFKSLGLWDYEFRIKRLRILGLITIKGLIDQD